MALTKREIRKLLMLEHLYEGGGNTTPTPVIPVSSAVLKSSGDVANPVVGDVLYLDIDYVSAGTDLQDYLNTTIVFNRDGLPITLIDEATQYMITQSDIGSLITCDLTIHEQGGNIQLPINLSTGSNVTGAAVWTLGDIQDEFHAMYLMTENVFPLIQKHATDLPTDVYKLRSISGNGIDLKTPQEGNIYAFDTDHINGPASGRMYFTNPVPNWDGTGATIFFKGTITSTVYDWWVYRYLGATNKYLIHYNDPHRKLEINGVTTVNDIAVTGDEVTIAIRFSDTAFTTLEPAINQKTEFYIYVDNGVTPVEYHFDSTLNAMSGSDFSYGLGGSDTAFWTGLQDVKAVGWSSNKLNDTDFINLKDYLISL